MSDLCPVCEDPISEGHVCGEACETFAMCPFCDEPLYGRYKGDKSYLSCETRRCPWDVSIPTNFKSQAEFVAFGGSVKMKLVDRLVKEAVDAEREACAKEVESVRIWHDGRYHYSADAAQVIRLRNQPTKGKTE